MKTYKTILLEKRGGIGYLTLNRPEVRNAFNEEMMTEIRDALSLVDGDEEIRVLIITGAGKVFQAGADIAELRAMTPMEYLRWNKGLIGIDSDIKNLRQPVIAAINGAAMGGGLGLAIACTLRVISESAKMGIPEVKLGACAGTGLIQELPKIIGKGRAAEWLLTGDPIDAHEAFRIGLVNRVVPDGEVVKAAEELAGKIIPNAPIAVEMTKEALEAGFDLPADYGARFSRKNCSICCSTGDMKEGMTAFLEKRAADFKGK
ncbi:MAG: enoyl-CoA hydratase/isomerase family protein [Pseudomonadota bacterium]